MSQRNALGPVDAASRSHTIQAAALDLLEYQAAGSVALYSPVQNEVGTEQLFEHALTSKKSIFYPKIVEGNFAEMVQINSAAELYPGKFGIAEPRGNKTLKTEPTVSLIMFVPGVAFDLQGNRLGRGQGCYDRILSGLPHSSTVVALAYEFQIVALLPVDAWDRKVQSYSH